MAQLMYQLSGGFVVDRDIGVWMGVDAIDAMDAL